MNDYWESLMNDYIAYRIFEEATREPDAPEGESVDLDTLLERLIQP